MYCLEHSQLEANFCPAPIGVHTPHPPLFPPPPGGAGGRGAGGREGSQLLDQWLEEQTAN